MQEIIFTNFSPITPVNLGSLVLEKHKQVSVLLGVTEQYHDTLLVNVDSPGKEVIRDWVVFHEFVMDSQRSIYYYDFAQFSQNLEIIGDCANLKDYHNLVQVDGKILDYVKLFKQYERLTCEQKGVIKNFLIKLDSHHERPTNPILDTQYWQLMVYYSVIEYVIGKQVACPNVYKCELSTCNAHNNGSSHNPKSYMQHVADYLAPRIVDGVIRERYLNCIKHAYDKVRNAVVHRGAMSEAVHVSPEPNSTETYNLERSIDEYTKDSAALMSLVLMVRDVARNLLLDKFFETGVFPELVALKSTRIVS